MSSYYYPLSSREYTFENIFSSESISPPAVYPIRGFGFDYFHLLETLNDQNALILYSSPPKYELQNGTRFILEIEESVLDLNCLVFLAEGIFAYQKTIYFTRDSLKLLFFSEKDMKVCTLRSESSLPTKCTNKYRHAFKVLDDSQTKVFEIKIDKKILTEDLNYIGLVDKRFNHFKGFVYGLVIGFLQDGSGVDVPLKRQLQEITNSFAELKSRLADPKNKQTHFYIEKLFHNIDRAKEMYSIFELNSDVSDDLLLDYLLTKQSRTNNRDEVKVYLDYLIMNDEIFGTNQLVKLKEQYYKQSEVKIPHFDKLKQSAYETIEQFQHPRGRSNDTEDYSDRFKKIVFEIGDSLERFSADRSVSLPLNIDDIRFDLSANITLVNNNLKHSSHFGDQDFLLVINAILKFSKSSKGPARKDALLQIVEHIGNKFIDRGRDTLLYQYLDNKIDAYSIEKASSVVMKNFVAFIFNPDSLEKLDNYLVNKNVESKWMAYAFWCAFNGFANISRNYTQAIFNDSNIRLQKDLDVYFSELLKSAQIEKPTVAISSEKSSEQTVRQRVKPEGPNAEDFFNRFVSKTYNLTLQQFKEILKIDDQLSFVTELKKKYSIPKKDGNKLFLSLMKYFDPSSLFG